MGAVHFLGKDGTFSLEQPENYSYLYFPVAGEQGIKGAVTPNFGGDSKINQNAFLMEPVSAENLHNNRSSRNFWCCVEGKGAWSVTGVSAEEENKKFTGEQDKSRLAARFMEHSVTRESGHYQLKATVTSFVPLGHNVEVMHVRIKNMAGQAQRLTPVAAVPVFGRSADNIRDHRHVTSLLHRIRTADYGVYVRPTLSFDERGHQENHLTYFVCGVTGKGEKPVSFYPVVEEYIGEGGSLSHPCKIMKNEDGVPAGSVFEGREALGGIRFPEIALEPGEAAEYIVFIGVTEQESEIPEILHAYGTTEKTERAREEMASYWQDKVNVRYQGGSEEFDNFMRWVSFQPILRRIYGCSFLPHHDYGRGGRGWRDLWQDCLSLLIMEPEKVRQMILANYGGVRIDGTNATIIGEKAGEFIADRNGIARVWMDHGVWPFMTTKFYIDQTGDIGLLLEKSSYFKDGQAERGYSMDEEWDAADGVKQLCTDGSVYEGSLLEHLLLQHLCVFYDVGSHNHMLLRGADWNDALDMAPDNGESVAFTCAYAGNLEELADLLETSGWELEVLEEMKPLLADDASLYEDAAAKREVLKKYLASCRHHISGRKIGITAVELAGNLRHKAEWIKEHVRRTEWITGEEGEGWFNSYYDNDRQPVEGYFDGEARMMLTGQVFAVMSGTAQKDQVEAVCRAADRYLYEREIGGYRLNTNFGGQRPNLGRMFGFAYGEKENGAVFSHMTVMYANALYKRGFVEEGHKALQTLANTALDFETSKIYPGIPEYFNADGRGMYHYLTGAASWYMLTMVTEVYGVRGIRGSLSVCPKLVAGQFDGEGNAALKLPFAGKTFCISYRNPRKLTYGEYQVGRAVCDGKAELALENGGAVLSREAVDALPDGEHDIVVELVELKALL